MIDRIDSRTQLIEFIISHSSRRAIARACHRGTVTVLGGFHQIPPGTEPGWIIIVISEYGRTWYLAVIAGEQNYRIRELKEIDWSTYIGRSDRGFYSIFDGDNPKRAALARDRVLEKTGQKFRQPKSASNPASYKRPADP